MEVIEYEQDCIEFIRRVIKHLPGRKQLRLLFDEFDVFGLTEDMEDESIPDTMASKQLIPYISDLIEMIQAKEYPVKFIFAIGLNYKDLNPGRFAQLMKFGRKRSYLIFQKRKPGQCLKYPTAQYLSMRGPCLRFIR